MSIPFPAIRFALLLAVIPTCAATTHAAVVIDLGKAQTFAVLGGSTVTNTGLTAIVGDVGVSPGTAIVFGPGTVTNGGLHANDALAAQAHDAAAIAYGQLAGLPFITANNLSDTDLGGLTLLPGVYHFNTAAELHGTLTLDGNGQVNPLFVFQIGTTLITASGGAVLLTNGASSSNLFFQVGTSSTFGIGTAFAGTIIAAASDTLTTGVSVDGRVFALDAAVTLDTNAVTRPAVPEPSAVFAIPALLGAAVVRPRRRTAR